MNTEQQIEKTADPEECRRHYEAGHAYEYLDMPEEAKAEYDAIPPESAGYAASQAERVGVLQAQGRFREASELGIAILKSGKSCRNLVINTALSLHLGHQFAEALTLLLENQKLLKVAEDDYFIATSAARCGNWEWASKAFLHYLKHHDPPNPWFFLDTDVEPWFEQLLDNPLSFEEAETLAHPLIRQRWIALPAPKHPIRVDALLADAMPRDFRLWLKPHLASGHLQWDYAAPSDLRARYLGFQQDRFRRGQLRLECLVAKAEAVLSEWQLPWAAAHAAKGNFLAARYHLFHALTQNLQRFHEFEQTLRPLDMGWLFDDILRAAFKDPQILKKLASVKRRAERHSELLPDLLDEMDSWHPRIHDTGMFLIQRGHLLEGMDKPDEALRCWQAVAARWPGDPVGFHNAANLLAKNEQWDKADALISSLPPRSDDILHVEATRKRIADRNMRQIAHILEEPFYGQRNLGGILRMNLQPLKWISDRNHEPPA